MTNKQIKITIPGEMAFVPIIIGNAGKLAELMGFPPNEINKIELGVEEAITGIIKNAFDDSNSTVDVVYTLSSLGLEIGLFDKGMPFDPSVVAEFSPEKFNKDLSEEGLGMYLMKKFMDEYSFRNLGKEGKETRLFKHLGYNRISNILSEEELKNAEKERDEESLPKGSVKYIVRKLKPEEAVEVSRCAYTSYGYTYVHEDVYYPDRVRELNKKGDMISFVAVKDDGEVIAHAALERESDRLVPQVGVAATKPKYRGQGCLTALGEARIREAKRLGCMGVYGRGITTHFFSQKALLKQGFNACALLLSSGKERKYKSIEQKKIQRESVCLMFRYLDIPDDITLYPPAKHRDFIASIYEHIDAGITMPKPANGQKLPETPTRITIHTDPDSLTADIQVEEYGKDIIEVIKHHLTLLCLDRVESIYIHLPLYDPLTSVVCEDIEKTGFFFAGIKPGSSKRDSLILQYLNNTIIDYDLLQFGSDMGREIMNYVRKNDPKHLFET